MPGRMCPAARPISGKAALRYDDELGPVSLSAYGAVPEGRAEHKLPGQEGVSDLGAGAARRLSAE